MVCRGFCMMPLNAVTAAQLNRAADRKNKIEALHEELAGILGSPSAPMLLRQAHSGKVVSGTGSSAA